MLFIKTRIFETETGISLTCSVPMMSMVLELRGCQDASCAWDARRRGEAVVLLSSDLR